MQRLTSSPSTRHSGVRWPATRLVGAVVTGATLAACSRSGRQPDAPPQTTQAPLSPASVESLTIESPAGTPRPPFHFDSADEKLLDDVQRGAFWFLWNQCSPTTGMVVDRSSVTFASTAGVGFQLAALPIGVERGWVTRAEATERALKILRALAANPNNRKAGLFYHFLTAADASPVPQDVVSTIDSTLLFAGMLVAGNYFAGEVRDIGDRLFAAADWTFFVEDHPDPKEPSMRGFISLGWRPDDFADPTGHGRKRPYYWADCGDEHRLVCFLAACAPEAGHRVDPSVYYRLRRPIGNFEGGPPMVYLPWSGAMFTNFFAHCFINYAAMGPDDPKAHGSPRRPRVDWWENSRRAVALHRAKAIAAHEKLPNLGENAWGLSACDVPDGYGVPGVYPDPITYPDMLPEVDFPNWTPKDDFGDGTLGCYAAGSCVMFEPQLAVSALRHYRDLKGDHGPLVWREPSSDPGLASYGFLDSFNAATGWVATDYVAIDQGPLVLAIENARTGRVWTWFAGHAWIGDGLGRLGLRSHPFAGR